MNEPSRGASVTDSSRARRVRKVIWASGLVVLSLSVVVFAEQGYRFYRITQVDVGPISGPLPPQFRENLRDFQTSMANAKVARLRDMQVTIMVLGVFIVVSAVVSFLARKPKAKPGDPPLPPLPLGVLWGVPFIGVPILLIISANVVAWVFQQLSSHEMPVATEALPNPGHSTTAPPQSDAAARLALDPTRQGNEVVTSPPIADAASPLNNDRVAPPLDRPVGSESPQGRVESKVPAQPVEPELPPLPDSDKPGELTGSNAFPRPLRESSSTACSVYGIHLGMARNEAEEILRQLPRLRFERVGESIAVLDRPPPGDASGGKTLIRLIWNTSSDSLDQIDLYSDFQSHLQPANARLLSREIVEDVSPYRQNLLGQADRVATTNQISNFKTITHFYDALGVELHAHIDENSRSVTLVLRTPIPVGTRQRILHGKSDQLRSLMYSQDGQTVLAMTDKQVQRWEWETGKELPPLGLPENVWCVLSADGRTLAYYAHDNSLRLWDMASAVQRIRFEETGQPHITGFTLSPNSKLLAASSLEGGREGVRLFDTKEGRLVGTLSAKFHVTDLAFVGNTKLVAASILRDRALLWDTETHEGLRSWRDLRVLASSPDGRRLAMVTSVTGMVRRQITFFDAESGVEAGKYESRSGGIVAAAFSPDGRMLAMSLDSGPSGDSNLKPIKLCTVPDGVELVSFNGHTGGPTFREDVYSLAFSPDGSILATAGADRVIRLWDLTKVGTSNR